QFKRRYHVDLAQSQRVTTLAERLFRMACGDECDPDTLKRLQWAARLHEIGLTIAHTAYHKHSAYILQNADMPGFSKREQATLASIVLGQRGDMGKMMALLSEPGLWQAMVALRLAVLFYRSRNDVTLPEVLDLRQTTSGFSLTVDKAWLSASPLTASAFKQEVKQWDNIGFTLDIVRA
ncbi:MAG TPA: exopolyphosphatase, partial [Pseudogulbenkiania sp.]|nr:exopolyphosphatase [Pseudogulbenkiania sp.]